MLAIGSNSGYRYISWCWRLLVAALLLLGSVQGVALAKRPPRSLDQWHKGPVRYLMNRTETRTFRRLKTNQERMTFIRRFWDRRDPDPRTPENERRLIFWTRVLEANRLFADAAKPGWMTDRGKIYVLLGPPTEIEERGDYNTGLATSSQGLLRWHYQGLRFAANPALTIIAFTRQGHNDWYLTTDPKLSSIYLNVNAPSNESFNLGPSLERVINMVPYGGGSLATAMDLGRLQEVPTERELLKAVVRAEQFLGTLQGTQITSEVSSPLGGSMLSITLAVHRQGIRPALDGSAVELAQRFTASAQLRPAGENSDLAVIEFAEEAFAPEPNPSPDDPWLRFQAIRRVPPGRWSLSGVVFDRKGGGASTHYLHLDLEPRPENAPSFTGPVLASLIREAEGPAGAGTHPFRVENHIIVPRMEQLIPATDGFALFLQVLPAPGDRSPVALDWVFERSEQEAGAYEVVGKPGHLDDAAGPRAWNLPPGKLRPGWYRVRFTATAADGTQTERITEFRVSAE